MRKLHLTARDFKIFQFLYETKISSKFQIGDTFFPGRSKQRVGVRMNLLFRGGFIGKQTIYDEEFPMQTYSLKPKGLTALNSQTGNIFSKRSLSSDSPVHDLKLVDIRRKFKLLESTQEYITENLLCGDLELDGRVDLLPFKNVNSDAVAVLKVNRKNCTIGIELEISAKSEERYRRKILEFYSSGIGGVLYICGNKKIIRALKNVDRIISTELGIAPLLNFMLFEDISMTSSPLIFTDYNNDLLTIT